MPMFHLISLRIMAPDSDSSFAYCSSSMATFSWIKMLSRISFHICASRLLAPPASRLISLSVNG